MLSGQTQLFPQSWDREGCITALRTGYTKAGSTENLMDMNLGKLQGMVRDREALQIAEKRREVKGKGEMERYSHLNQSSKE